MENFDDIIMQQLPKRNPAIKGFVKRELNKAAALISSIWKDCAGPTLPDCIRYVGYQRCDPETSARVLTEHNSSKKRVELSRSDVCVYAFEFELTEPDGKISKINSYLTLPHCFNDSNDLIVKGTSKTISPVLSDIVFSRVNAGIFVPFTRDRLTFQKLDYIYMINGQTTNDIVTYCNIHHYCKSPNNKSLNKPKTTMGTYLFARWGFYETFEKYLGITEDDLRMYTSYDAAEFALGEDRENWDLFSSYGYAPKKIRGYQPCTTVLALRKSKQSETARLLIASFFYIADICPEDFNNLEWLKTKDHWVRTLGDIIHKDEPNASKIHKSTEDHLDSLDQYLDGDMEKKLQQRDLYYNNFFDFMIYMIDNMGELLRTLDPASLSNKKLSCLDYVLLDVIKSIFQFTYSVKKSHTLDRKTVAQRFSKFISRDVATNFNKHGEVSSMSFPGDCLYYKLTTSLVSQTQATSKASRSKMGLNDSSRNLDANMLAVTSPLAQTKPIPEGISKLSIWSSVDGNTYCFIKSEEQQVYIDLTQKKIKLQ